MKEETTLLSITNVLCSVVRSTTSYKVSTTVINMHFRSLFYFQLMVASYANTNMIRDYFVFKQISRVVGFSCGNNENDYQIVKMFNDAGIPVLLKQLGSNVDVPRFLYTDYWSLGVFLDLRCSFEDEDVIKLFDKTSAYYMFDHLHQWLILSENMNHTVQLLNDSVFSIITDVVISVPIPTNESYVLYDVYNHCKPCGGSLNITKFGSWESEEGLTVELSEDKFSRRWDYYKMRVKVAGLVVRRPKGQILTEYLREQNEVRLDNWSKFGYALMVHVAEMFNLTLVPFELDYWDKNDTNGPMISGLNKKIFDLGYYPSVLTKPRLDRANVITQVWPARTCFMFLTIPSSRMDMNSIFKPFSTDVWYMIFLLGIVIIFTLWITFKAEENKNDSDHGTTILIIVAAICQQGLPFDNNKSAGRVAFFYTMVFGLLVYNYYSAEVVSVRLNAPLNKMNDSLYSLMNSRMKLTAFKDIYFNFLLGSSVTEVQHFKKHWDTLPENKKFRSMEDGLKGIMQGGYAFHADPNKVYPLIERTFSKQMICQLTEVHLFRPNILGLWSAQHSQFNEITKIGLIRIATAGIRKRQLLRWSTSKPYCDTDKHYVSRVTIYEVTPIIVLLSVGIVLSIIICFIENIVYYILREKHKRKQLEQVPQNVVAVIRKKIVPRKVIQRM